MDSAALCGMWGEIKSSEAAVAAELTGEEDDVSDTAHSALLIYQRERKRWRRTVRRYRGRGMRWLTRSPRNPTITANGNCGNAWTGEGHVGAQKINCRDERLRKEATRRRSTGRSIGRLLRRRREPIYRGAPTGKPVRQESIKSGHRGRATS